MKFSTYKTNLQNALAQKNLALWACAGLVLCHVILCLKVLTTEEKWVLIPQHNIEHRIPLTASQYSDDYFIEWAGHIVNTMLCVNPDSYDWKMRQILNITTQNYGSLKDKLFQEAIRVKQDQISTVFYPKTFRVNQQAQSIDVTGQHMAYFGKQSTPVETEKTFRLSWIIAAHGVVLLKDFQEIKDA